MSLHDLDGRFIYVSPSITPVLGYSIEEALGEDSFTVMHPDDRERIRREMEREIATRDVGQDPRLLWTDLLRGNVYAAVCQPLMVGKQVTGVLWAVRKTEFMTGEIRVLEVLRIES